MNAVDDDLNGFTDCADRACAYDPNCRVHENCSNGCDDDLNGLTDCADPVACCVDPVCLASPYCGTTPFCLDLVCSSSFLTGTCAAP